MIDIISLLEIEYKVAKEKLAAIEAIHSRYGGNLVAGDVKFHEGLVRGIEVALELLDIESTRSSDYKCANDMRKMS